MVSLSLGCAGTSWWRAWCKEYQKHDLRLYKQDPRKELKTGSNNKRAGFQMGFSSRLSSIYLLLALSMSSAFCPLNADACSLNSYILMFEISIRDIELLLIKLRCSTRNANQKCQISSCNKKFISFILPRWTKSKIVFLFEVKDMIRRKSSKDIWRELRNRKGKSKIGLVQI